MSTVSPLTTALFQRADTNQNGQLTTTEFSKIATAVTGTKNLSEGQLAAAFKGLDSDGSGGVSVTELASTSFTGNTLSPATQANIAAYASLTSALSGTSSSAAAGLYASLTTSPSSSGRLTESLLGASLAARKIL